MLKLQVEMEMLIKHTFNRQIRKVGKFALCSISIKVLIKFCRLPEITKGLLSY